MLMEIRHKWNYKDVVTLGKSTPGKPKVHLNTVKMQLTTYCLQIETKGISDWAANTDWTYNTMKSLM